MILAKAVQIAVEAIRLQRLKITFNAGMFKIYHREASCKDSDNARNRACAELYDRYTEAIELLTSLVTKPISPDLAKVSPPVPGQGLVTIPLSQAPDPGTNLSHLAKVSLPSQGLVTNSLSQAPDPGTMVTNPDQPWVDPDSSLHSDVDRDIERRIKP
jgi:hypothetical protein